MGQSLKRRQDWPERLIEFLQNTGPLDWETNNCALFSANAVLAITGVDFAKDYRGPKTKRGMLSKLRRVCGGNVEDAATRELGEPMKTTLSASRGDIVSYDFGDGPALGVCLGSQAVFVSENDGLVNVPSHLWRKAWRV